MPRLGVNHLSLCLSLQLWCRCSHIAPRVPARITQAGTQEASVRVSKKGCYLKNEWHGHAPRMLFLCLHGFSGPLSRVCHHGTLFLGSLLHGHNIHFYSLGRGHGYWSDTGLAEGIASISVLPASDETWSKKAQQHNSRAPWFNSFRF